MSKEVRNKANFNTGKSSGALIKEASGGVAGKTIFDFHSVSKDYFPAAIHQDEENFRRKCYRLNCAELLFKNEMAL